MMLCPQCAVENKDQAKACRKCGANLLQPSLWRPSWAWHGRTLMIIYGVVIVLFFLLHHALKPYVRQLPADITPWMHGKAAFKSAYDPAR
jgi:hypothetical protein